MCLPSFSEDKCTSGELHYAEDLEINSFAAAAVSSSIIYSIVFYSVGEFKLSSFCCNLSKLPDLP